ncbi:MAG: PilX N-terminal domain-containing pilus assembly protein [Sedimenticola sp.]|nr:PilX N-terminal domain-containing pilus assembly protein [Sedimenticola sp.]
MKNRVFSQSRRSYSRQRGAVLVVSLLILLVMTIISVTALRSTSMDEKMASNTRQRQIAFNAAETAMRAAETWLATNVSSRAYVKSNFTGATGTGRYSALTSLDSVSAPASWDATVDSNWTLGNSVEVSDIPMLNSKHTAGVIPGRPRYRVEYIGRIGDPPLNYTDPDLREFAFRITAIGWGQETGARYLLSSTFRMQL